MRISEEGQVVTVSDVPGCLWLFGLWFVAGGLFVIAMLFIATNSAELSVRDRILITCIGVVTTAAGVYTIGQQRATRTVFDRGSGACSHTVRTVLGRATRLEFALADVRRLQIVPSRDSEGDPMYQLRLWLSDSRALWLQAQPASSQAGVAADKRDLERLLGLGEGAL